MTSFSRQKVAIPKTKNIRFVRMICSMFMENFVETGWKLKKLKHVGALACIFVRREMIMNSIFHFSSVNMSHCTDISKKTTSTVRRFRLNLINIDRQRHCSKAVQTTDKMKRRQSIFLNEITQIYIYLDAKSCSICTQVNF